MIPITEEMDDFLTQFKRRLDSLDASRPNSQPSYSGVQVRGVTTPFVPRKPSPAPALKDDPHVPDSTPPIFCCEWPWPTVATPLYPVKDLPAALSAVSNTVLVAYTLTYDPSFPSGISGYSFNGTVTIPLNPPFSVELYAGDGSTSPGAGNGPNWEFADGFGEYLSCLPGPYNGVSISPPAYVWDQLNDSYTVDFGSGVTILVNRVVKNVVSATTPVFGSCNWVGANSHGSEASLTQITPGTTPESGISRIRWQILATFKGTDPATLGGGGAPIPAYPASVPGYKDYTNSTDTGSSPDQGGGFYETDSTGLRPVVS